MKIKEVIEDSIVIALFIVFVAIPLVVGYIIIVSAIAEIINPVLK